MMKNTFWIFVFCLPTVAVLTVLRGSDCDVSTNASDYDRVGCSENKDSNTTRIEIKNVTANDTGLYTVEREDSFSQRSFLNSTGTYPNSASASIIVTPPESFEENNSDQPSNITLSTNVLSSTVVNMTRSQSVLPEHQTYVTDVLSQNAFVIKTWTYHDSSLFVTVKKGNKTLLNAYLDGVVSVNKDNRLLIQYNKSTKEVSLLLNNVTRSDEGIYQISTSINQTTPEGSEIMDNKWNFQLNVLEPGEIKQGHIGENILITQLVHESIFFPRLYHNDQLIAAVRVSDCDLNTNSPFHGRIRCSKDKDNTIRIEINNVTENDTGLYKLKTEGNLTWRCFLNITGTYTYSANALISITPPESFDGINSDQPRNITLSTTANSSTVVHLPRLQSELFYIPPITTVAVVAIILLFGSLIWIQRRNIKRFKAVQRIVLETMKTASSTAFSTLGRRPHTLSMEEIWRSNSNSLRSTFTNPAGRLQYPTPKVSTSGHITCHNNIQQPEDEYSTFDVTDNIIDICEFGSRWNKTLLAECRQYPGSLINACSVPSDAFPATENELHLDRQICNANGQCQLTPNTETTYAEVKKLSSRNNVKAGASCKDGYEMVDFSHFDNPTNGVQAVEHALASKTPNQTFVGISTSVDDLDPGTKDEEANTVFANVMNHASAENVMSYDEEKSFSGRKEEQ